MQQEVNKLYKELQLETKDKLQAKLRLELCRIFLHLIDIDRDIQNADSVAKKNSCRLIYYKALHELLFLMDKCLLTDSSKKAISDQLDDGAENPVNAYL